MLVRDGNYDSSLFPDDVKHLVWETVKYKTPHGFDFDLPGKRTIPYQSGCGFRLALKRFA
jgi:hypothetical protein